MCGCSFNLFGEREGNSSDSSESIPGMSGRGAMHGFSVTGLEVIGPNLAFDGHLAVSFADVLDSRHIIFAEVLKGEPC